PGGGGGGGGGGGRQALLVQGVRPSPPTPLPGGEKGEDHPPGRGCDPRSTMLHPAMAFIPKARAFSSTAALELPGLNHTCRAGFLASSGNSCKQTSGGR